MAQNGTFEAENTELGELVSASVRRVGSALWAASFPWEHLTGLITVLQASAAAPAKTSTRGVVYQVAVDDALVHRIQWLGDRGSVSLFTFGRPEVADLISVLQAVSTETDDPISLDGDIDPLDSLQAVINEAYASGALLGTWQFAGVTTTPSKGKIGLNVATPATATTLYVHQDSRSGQSFAGVQKLLGPGATIYAQVAGSPDAWIKYSVTGTVAVTGNVGAIPAQAIEFGTGSVSNNSTVNLLFVVGDPSAGKAATVPRAFTMVGLGDSQTANAGNVLVNPDTDVRGSQYWGDPAWHLFAQISLNSRVESIANVGVGGYTIQQIHDTLLPRVIRIAPTFCVVLAGENDKTTLTSATLATLSAIYDRLEGAGIVPVLCTIPPTSTDANVYRLNDWIRREARRRGRPLADLHAALVNPATGLWAAGTNVDSAHPSAAGGMRMGTALANALAPLVASGDPGLADDNVSTGALTPGPLFLTDNGGNPPFPSAGWNALTTYAVGAFSYSAAETSAEGRYLNINRISGVDNWVATGDWTVPQGNVLRVALGVKMTIPASGKVEIYCLPPSGNPTNQFRAVFSNAITGVLAFEFPAPAGLTGYAGFKVQFRVYGADGTILSVKRFTARDLTASGVIS